MFEKCETAVFKSAGLVESVSVFRKTNYAIMSCACRKHLLVLYSQPDWYIDPAHCFFFCVSHASLAVLLPGL